MVRNFVKNHHDALILLLLMLMMGSISAYWKHINLWDFQNYHWYNAYAFLNNRMGYDIAPAQLQTYFNPLLDTFNYLIIKVLIYPTYIEFVFGAFNGITIYFLLKIATLIFSNQPKKLFYFAVLCSSVIGLTSPCFIEQIGIGYTDAETATFVIASIYCCIQSLDSYKKQKSYLIIAGILIGLATGLKLVNACYFIGIFCALFFTLKKNKLSQLLSFICSFSVLFILTEGFWMWHLYKLYQNPFFPMFNHYFHSPFADNNDYVDHDFQPRTIMQWVFYPFYWLRKNDLVNDYYMMRDWRPALTIILGLLYVLKQKRFYISSQKFKFLMLFIIISYIFWLKQFSIYRYFLPVILLTGIVSIQLCLHLILKLNHSLKILSISSLTIVLICTSSTSYFGLNKFKEPLNINIPQIPRDSYVILINRLQALGYLIPYFPSKIRFIALYNYYFLLINDKNLLAKTTVNLMNNHKNQLYVIDTPNSFDSHIIKNTLKFYNFEIAPKSCENIYSSLPPYKYQLCKVRAINHSSVLVN